MIIEQIYTGCLAQGTYYIESNGEVAIIDPLRETDDYVKKAEQNQAKIKYIFETHFHADFVSGHVDLAKKTKASIVYGPTQATLGFEAIIASHNQEFKLGNVIIRVIHTPGHTLESSCFLLIDENQKEVALFSGDTLFIGDVGRPDLAQKINNDLTPEKLAAYLFDSLRNKIMTLPDDVIIYPAHGAGSACGKNMSTETTDTLKNQKETNYALNPNLTKEEFIHQVLDGLTTPPGYFPKNVMMNIQGYDSIDEVLERGTHALSPDEFEVIANSEDVLILDTRNEQDFAKAHIPNSIFIGIDGSFAIWVGTLIPNIKQKILLVCDENREEEVVTRLSRVGYDGAIGYLKGNFSSWIEANKEIDKVESIDVEQYKNRKSEGKLIDVRKTNEYLSQHVVEATHLPLDEINQNMNKLNKEETFFIHCGGGYRSMIFISILKSRGFHQLIDIKGGFKAIKESNLLDLSNEICPSKL